MTTPLPRPDFELAGFDVATFIRATLAEDLGEGLPGGGVRLVCMSNEGAELIRKKLKRYVIDGEVTRERFRPKTGTW